jgi:uncharacterized protein YbcC (UPF0753/DUF2309 family)
MQQAAHAATGDGHDPAMDSALTQALQHAAHLLPDQAPMRVFIHHNTLHAFQHLHFHEAVLRGREVYGGEPYLSEERFRSELASGRIHESDIDAVLQELFPEDEGALIAPELSVRALRRLLMLHPVQEASAAELAWLLSEGKLTRALRDDLSPEARARLLAAGSADVASALYAACQKRAELVAQESKRETNTPARGEQGGTVPLLHRDLLLAAGLDDAFDLLFPVLIRMSSAYLDDGVAHWTMPQRERGFYYAVRELVATDRAQPGPFFADARRIFEQQRAQGLSARSAALTLLEELGVPAAELAGYVEKLLLSLPGWAGMMSRLERRPEERRAETERASLLDFLAVRLSYELAALRTVAARAHGRIDLSRLYRERAVRPCAERCEADRGFRLFQLAQLAGLTPARVASLEAQQLTALLSFLDDFDALARRRVFQEAYEHHHRVEVLSALAAQRTRADLRAQQARPKFQVVCCFDEREESFRRHIEEVTPSAQTFGAPGFFGAAIRFRGIDEAQHVPLAPVVLTPTHLIEERPRHSDRPLLDTRRMRRERSARAGQALQRGTRSLWRGILFNALFGVVAIFPLLARLMSPRLAGRLRSALSERFFPTPRTELTVHHDSAADLPAGITQRGFTEDERVARVLTVLENIGFTRNFAPIVLVLGHGSTTLNNPHKSAYDCGACGGRQGGPNARVFCQMANDPLVRAKLALRGVHIPSDTWFSAGQHDTCEDEVHLFDLASCPDSHRAQLRQVVLAIDEARARNAQERCRRLFSAPKAPTPREALRHVEGRSEHLAEPRPEFGHATNAVAVVGRRALTQGLFMDRRAFLLSYDPTIDEDGKILERTLAAATPVGAGINLEYYFSNVDNEVYGAGSKLPHNVTGLFGVMSGHASDLRTGLPRQMIEIHEPVRLLVVVEATPERLLEIAGRQAEVRELVVNRWVQLVSLHPESGAMQVFSDRGFVPFSPEPAVLLEGASSEALYRGHTGPLGPRRIEPPAKAPTTHTDRQVA